MVRGHEQSRKDMHGFLRIAERGQKGAVIRVQDHRPLGAAREARLSPLQESERQKLDRPTCHRGGEGLRAGHWGETFERGSAHIRVALSLPGRRYVSRKKIVCMLDLTQKEPSHLQYAK